MTKEAEKYTKPVFLKRLHTKLDSYKELGDLLGCSASHAGNMIKEDVPAAIAYEMAAENIFQKRFGGGADNKVAIISAPNHVLQTVEALVVQLNGKFHLIP